LLRTLAALLVLLCAADVSAQELDDFTTWEMTEVVEESSRFPGLPGDPAMGSISIGDVSDGFLVNALRLGDPNPNTAFLPVQFRRGLVFTTDELGGLVTRSAASVAQEYPESVVYLGNFSASHGGDIPYSVSHNSGRDCDVAFFMKDADGAPYVPPDLIELDEFGVAIVDELPQPYYFDVDRNWALIQALLSTDHGRLQYVFVSLGLKGLLIEHAKKKGVSAELLAAANEILQQPSGSLPHNDHFHLRVFCSDDDVWGGCKDQGRSTSRFRPDFSLRLRAQTWAAGHLTDPDAAIRAAAVRRLGLLEGRTYVSQIGKLLDDESSDVRMAAARTLGMMGRGERDLATRLKTEVLVPVRLEIISALSDQNGSTVVNALSSLLETPAERTLEPGLVIDERALAADALANLEDSRGVKALIATLADAPDDLKERVAVALRKLTNHPFDAVEGLWQDWYKKEGKKRRTAWLVAGFRDAGYRVDSVSTRYVWELCRAIDGPDWVSFNAQRALMQIAGKEVPSLQWSRADASFYWRRWFERRVRKFRMPPIPADMSTLTPKASVSAR
jgi:hypothetical protein